MRYDDILNYITESQERDIKRVLRDALISLKTSGLEKISVDQVLADFKRKGMEIDKEELNNLLQGDPMIQDISGDQITFRADAGKTPLDAKINTQQNQDQMLSNMAKQATSKRMKD